MEAGYCFAVLYWVLMTVSTEHLRETRGYKVEVMVDIQEKGTDLTGSFTQIMDVRGTSTPLVKHLMCGILFWAVDPPAFLSLADRSKGSTDGGQLE